MLKGSWLNSQSLPSGQNSNSCKILYACLCNFQFNKDPINSNQEPEDQWSCKCSPDSWAYYTEKKKHHMHFPMHFSKSTLFSDISRYVYYVTDIRLPDALICFLFQTIAEELATFDWMHETMSKTRIAHFLLGRLSAMTTNPIPFEFDRILQMVSRNTMLNFLWLRSCLPCN